MRVVNDNIWNERKRLSPKFESYHILNNTYRKHVEDFELSKYQEKEDIY
jgi:hypothetical protein